ncbi:HHLA2 protein, partial [Rhinopomastus cyanomelas]|nr:HHLA2 protein [Rhinopomastus cyanomelas]
EQEIITGLFSRDCILPCRFPPGVDEVIYWKKGDRNVHSYYYKGDQLEMQHPAYKGRTHLFHQEISNGNASLKLSNLTVTDEGLYSCYVGTQQGKTEVEATLHVRVSSLCALEYQKTDTERTLMCYAFRTYPEPHISWIQGNLPIQETHRLEMRDGVLYSLRSDQSIITTSDPYYCYINLTHDKVLQLSVSDQLPHKEGHSTAIPCEFSNNTANTEDFSVVWTLNRNAVVSVLATFNGTFHSYYPRVHINHSDFSLVLRDLRAEDSGEYVCNISTHHYTKLTVRPLQV